MKTIQRSISVKPSPPPTTEIFANRVIQRSISPLAKDHNYGQFIFVDIAIITARYMTSHKDVLNFLSTSKTFLTLPLIPYHLRVALTFEELFDSSKIDNPKIQFANQNGLKLKIKIQEFNTQGLCDFVYSPENLDYLKYIVIQALIFPEITSANKTRIEQVLIFLANCPHIISLSFTDTIWAQFTFPKKLCSIEEMSFAKIYDELDFPSLPELKHLNFEENKIEDQVTLSQLQFFRAQIDTKQKAS